MYKNAGQCSFVLSQITSLTDRRTDSFLVAMQCMQRGTTRRYTANDSEGGVDSHRLMAARRSVLPTRG